MKTVLKKLLALSLTVSLFTAQAAFAQTVPNEPAADTPAAGASVSAPPVQPADAEIPAVVVTAPDATTSIDAPDAAAPSVPDASADQVVDIQGSTTTLQDTAGSQPAVEGSVLESTTNPEAATSSDITTVSVADATSTGDSTLPLADATTTSDTSHATSTLSTPIDEGAAALDVVAENVDANPPPDATVPDPAVPDPDPAAPQAHAARRAPAVISADIAPGPEYTFALTGKQIPARQKIKDKNGDTVGEQVVVSPLMPQVDNASGTVSVSGQCSDKYFVVLLFKNANDYADDPRSYIFNSAYPCENGSFSYQISELPGNLPNGAYYMLIGQEGDRSTWTPITSLTEITINKN